MLRLAAALSLTVAAVLAPAAAAEGGPPQGSGCDANSVHAAGETWEGSFTGGPVFAPGSVVEITCEVVDAFTGEVVASVASGPQRDVAFAAGPVSYPYDNEYDYCTTVTVDGESWRETDQGTWEPGGRDCRAPRPVQVPPECLLVAAARRSCDYLGPLIDTIDETLADLETTCTSYECSLVGIAEQQVCGVLAAAPEVPGVVEFADDDGDVSLLGEPFYDCWPWEPPA